MSRYPRLEIVKCLNIAFQNNLCDTQIKSSQVLLQNRREKKTVKERERDFGRFVLKTWEFPF